MGFENPRDSPKTEQPKEGLPKVTDNVRDSGQTFVFGRSNAGEQVDEKAAMQIPTVYACVRLLAESIAALPLHLYRVTDDNGNKEKARDHPLYKILYRQPNPEMTSFVFWETLMTHLLLWGNAYAQIVRDGKNTVLGLYPLLPENVEVDRDESGELYYIYHAYTDEVPGEQNKDLYFRRDEIFHVPGLGFNGLIGFSPIAMMKNSLGTSIAVDKYGSSFFKNGAQPSGVLEHPGVVKDPNRIRDSWEAAYGGAANAHRVAVLEEGMAYKPISLPPEDSQFLETKQFSVTEICRIFRVPPHLVADLSRATFSNIEYQSLNFVMHSLTPWLVRIEQGIMLSAYKLGTMIKISNELLNDSAFDLATYIARRFGVRMGNAEERAFITGDGVGKPLGLLAETGGAKVGVTAAQKDAVTFDEIFKLYYALKAPYRKKAQFLCNEALVLQLMTIKDNNGNYIWKPGLEIGKPDTLLNRPLKTSAFMPEIKGGSKVITIMAVTKKIEIDGKEVTFKASAAVPRLYRIKFGRDIYKDLRQLEKSVGENDEDNSNLDLFSLEMFEDLAWLMARHADPAKVPDSPEEFLDQFNTFSIYQILPQLIELWGLNVQTEVESRKNLEKVSGK